MDINSIIGNIVKIVSKLARKYIKKDFKTFFIASVLLLTIIKHIFPAVAGPVWASSTEEPLAGLYDETGFFRYRDVAFLDKDSNLVKHKIFSVPGFKQTFPDENDVQLVAAEGNGISAAADRKGAEQASDSLVCVESNMYYDVDKLRSSVPYLVPRAALLLQDIGHNFCDSLLIKNIPLHKIIVTSVLRTREDIEALQRRNGNATTNSCHLHGTTFDICYNRYSPADENVPTGNDSLKWILSEVLRDFRESGRCYVKYEVRQACYHITVR